MGHFRSARSGVYMVSRRTDSVIRFGVLRFGWDAQEGGRIEGQETQARGKVRTEGSGLATAHFLWVEDVGFRVSGFSCFCFVPVL